MRIKRRVEQIVRKYRTRDPFEMIKGMNVILVYYPLEGVHGFYQYFQRNNIIYLDERLSKNEQRFVLAHELGHMFLHKKANAIFMDTRTQFNTDKFELEANTFAIDLLLPDSLLEEYKEFTVEQISRLTGYHKKLIELRVSG
ncbi:ImmA/IrrE family metallo-endopeptidase [Blautia ammoniilytica]|uniref:ImmA/IrrE family metallo-endopeptidase n=1 Tax=Blautia ammoniilytica TaxID=2981782 RepID=A0ABT2TTM9_9FIRM|nr:ImmA/IrrE family metallo-endopeptidase [Blautia ammoniilytica]MCU6765593.1 ImmA/IrrE family metallo-endopeptidase [Blautia ammoniilytica]SCI13214.1 Metallopeptidase immA [uncultured Blautia sp.]